MNHLETLLLVILGGFAATFWILSRDYNPTAALFPSGIAIACLVLVSVLITRSKKSRAEESIPGFSAQLPALGLQAVYVCFMYLIGFLGTTLVFLLVAPFQMGYTRRTVIMTHAVILTLVLAASFLWLFNVRLPAGIIWDLW